MSDPLNLSTPLAPPATTVSTTSTDLVLAPPARRAGGRGEAGRGHAADRAVGAPAAAGQGEGVRRRPDDGRPALARVRPEGRLDHDDGPARDRRVEQRLQPDARAPRRGPQRDPGQGPGAQAKVAGSLAELRNTITELDPGHSDLQGARKIFKFIPGGNKLKAYFDRYQSAQSQLDAIIKALASGQDELRKDNAAIEGERGNMWALMGKLSEYAVLAGALDAAVEQKVAELNASGKAQDAQTLSSDALFPIRQRRQDILTQMAVAVQGYLALDLVKKNNVELIKGVDRAQTTTVAALRTAVIVAQALANQKLVLDQINALNTTTSAMIESTSVMLQQQGAQIQQQAASSTVSIEHLQRAFDNVFATMDAIDTYKAQAVTNMAQTVAALEGQVAKAKPYLERSHTDSQVMGEQG